MTWTHIILPAAGIQAFETAQQAFNPATLLPLWKEVESERVELHEDSLNMPFEIAYARALELPSDEGAIAWAAFETQTLGQACAWVHPCHLDVGMTDMVLQPTERLRLSDAESRELHALIGWLWGRNLRILNARRWRECKGAASMIFCLIQGSFRCN
jgi:hypothetical protein